MLPYLFLLYHTKIKRPRWLAEKGCIDEAHAVLESLRPRTHPTTQELYSITTDISSRPVSRRAFITLSISLFRDKALFARMWRAFLLQFMAQMCGATAMKYYLPDLLSALGIPHRLALMAGAAEMTVKIGMTVVEMWLIDRLGRKVCLVGGSLVMGIAMLVNGVLPMSYPDNTNKTADVICIVFIFIYAMGYSLGLGPAAWVYSSEIFPTSVRARGLNFAASGGSIGSILVSQIWPIGIANVGSGIYLFFMVVNFVCAPLIWILYPETKGRALEDMDGLFGSTREGDLALRDSVDEERDGEDRAAAAADNRDGEESRRLLGAED